MGPIASSLARLHDEIAAAALSVRRDPTDITLVAVSKTHPIVSIEAALAAGQRVFGENTVQEALGKIAHFARREPARRVTATSEVVPEWHFIGHLQSNKAKSIPGNFLWLHSLDSVKLAARLHRIVQEQNAELNVLIEVNITGDPRKHGVAPPDVAPMLDQLLARDLAGIRLRGLMAIGPYPAAKPDIRLAYAGLRELRDQCQRRFDLPAFDQLSMGMSGDYVEAVKEGATMLRIGTAIFGERDYRESN